MTTAGPAKAPSSVVHIVEDDEDVLDSLAMVFRARGFHVREHACPRAFLDQVEDLERGCIVTDLQMPQMSGLELLSALRGRGVDWPALLISGRPQPQTAMEAAALDAEFFDKPFQPDTFVAIVRRLLGED